MKAADWDILKDHITYGKNVSVIDIGCGDGDLAKEFLNKRNGTILGIERDEERFNICSSIKNERFKVVKAIDEINDNFDYGFYFGLYFAPQYEIDFLQWLSKDCSVLFTHSAKMKFENYNYLYGLKLREIYKNVEEIGFDSIGKRTVFKCC